MPEDKRGVTILLEHMLTKQVDAKAVNADDLACTVSQECSLVVALAEQLLSLVWIMEYEYSESTGDYWLGNLQRKLKEAGLKNPY